MPRIAQRVQIAEKRKRLVKGLEQVLRVIEGFERGEGSQFGRTVAKRKLEEMIAHDGYEEGIKEELIELHALMSCLDGASEMVEIIGRRNRMLIQQHS